MTRTSQSAQSEPSGGDKGLLRQWRGAWGPGLRCRGFDCKKRTVSTVRKLRTRSAVVAMSVRLEVPRVVGHPAIVAVAVCARRLTPQTVIIAVVFRLVHIEWWLHRGYRRCAWHSQRSPCAGWWRWRHCSGLVEHAGSGSNANSDAKRASRYTQPDNYQRDDLSPSRQPCPPGSRRPHNHFRASLLFAQRAKRPLLCGHHVPVCSVCSLGGGYGSSILCEHRECSRVSVRE